MTEKTAIELLANQLRAGTTKHDLVAVAFELVNQIDTWIEVDQLILKAEMAL